MINADVRRGQMLVHRLALAERDVSPVQWDLADLTAENVGTAGGDRSKNESLVFAFPEWAEEIGWEETGYGLRTLQAMVTEARAWPKDRRVESATFWGHYEARKYHKGDIDKARQMLIARANGETVPTLRTRVQRDKTIIQIVNDISGWVTELVDLCDEGYIADEFDSATFTHIATELMECKEKIDLRREQEAVNV